MSCTLFAIVIVQHGANSSGDGGCGSSSIIMIMIMIIVISSSSSNHLAQRCAHATERQRNNYLTIAFHTKYIVIDYAVKMFTTY